jgi:hypothetical protein
MRIKKRGLRQYRTKAEARTRTEERRGKGKEKNGMVAIDRF